MAQRSSHDETLPGPPASPEDEARALQGHAAIPDQHLLEDELFHLEVSPELALRLESIHGMALRLDDEGLRALMAPQPGAHAVQDANPVPCARCAAELEGLGLPSGTPVRCAHNGAGH